MTLQETVSALLKKPVTEQEAQVFASKQFGTLVTYMRENDPKFPRGFSDWHETHFDIVEAITNYTNSSQVDIDDEANNTSIATRWREQGIGGMYELAQEWTNKFEEKFKEEVWGQTKEYRDTIEEFINEKIYGKA